MERRRGENEGHVAFGKTEEGRKRGSEVFYLLKEERVGDVAVGVGVDEDCGGGSGGGDERESVVGDGKRFRGMRERDVWTETVESLSLTAKATVWVDGVSHGRK